MALSCNILALDSMIFRPFRHPPHLKRVWAGHLLFWYDAGNNNNIKGLAYGGEFGPCQARVYLP
jgi:hypothetical protein